MRKTRILMNKRVHLGLPILDLSKTVMYEFWYDYVKPKYGENAKLCHTLCEKCPNMELFLSTRLRSKTQTFLY